VLIPENIFKGFQSMGIWPLNSEAMADKIGPSEVYEVSRPDDGTADIYFRVEEIGEDVAEVVDLAAQHFYV
jgi:hypothetical protein